MNPKISGVLIAAIVLATFLTGGILYPQLHNAKLAFGLPIVLVMLFGLWALLPAIDPVRPGFTGFRYIYDLIWILLTALLAYAYALKLGMTIGWRIDVLSAILPAIAVLFLIIGALLPRIQRNWFFGIRTPWTLSSDEDWERTHRFARPLFMLAGGLIFIGTFLPRPWDAYLLVGAILFASLTSVIYSYIIFRRQ